MEMSDKMRPKDRERKVLANFWLSIICWASGKVSSNTITLFPHLQWPLNVPHILWKKNERNPEDRVYETGNRTRNRIIFQLNHFDRGSHMVDIQMWPHHICLPHYENFKQKPYDFMWIIQRRLHLSKQNETNNENNNNNDEHPNTIKEPKHSNKLSIVLRFTYIKSPINSTNNCSCQFHFGAFSFVSELYYIVRINHSVSDHFKCLDRMEIVKYNTKR